MPANASTTTASNNYAKPWIGTFQLLNDSGQPVTLPNGFNGNVTLSAEGATSTVGSVDLPERQRGGDDDAGASPPTRSTTPPTSRPAAATPAPC